MERSNKVGLLAFAKPLHCNNKKVVFYVFLEEETLSKEKVKERSHFHTTELGSLFLLLLSWFVVCTAL